MKRYFIIILHIIFPLIAFAQMRITGTITDTDGEPMAGVSIQVRNITTNKTTSFGRSDIDGNFSINVAADSFLEVSMLGFKKQRFDNIKNDKPLKIVMHEDAIALKEVTVKAEKVRQYGDTLIYNVASYADKKDRSIGEVLARIPGFEVNSQTGQIKYEDKPINKFYIDGIDMLGSKYGVATNSVPQVDVGSVQVLKNHQPIRVLESFTYTDDTAVNIRMKEGAKNHWVTSFKGVVGIAHHMGLWMFEGFALRLKPEYQTMLTYKTNNTGVDISKETTSLFSHEDSDVGDTHIRLSRPTTPYLATQRSTFNRSHALTINTMKRFNESSQMNIQLIYNNRRETAGGERHTEYFLNEGIYIIDSRKDYTQKDNELFALIKYEQNSENLYLKNSLSGNFTWSRQWLDETGESIHNQYAWKPEYDIKDNLHIIRKYGNKIVSFYSNNRIVIRPQSLAVDTLFQKISTHRYSTDTYAIGGIRFGNIGLSLKVGINAILNHLVSNLTGVDGLTERMTDNSDFSFVSFYMEPIFTYDKKDISISFSPTPEYIIEKYSHDARHRMFPFSPKLRIDWKVTPRLHFTLKGKSELEYLDENRFYRSLILQDFQYISQGYAGYSHNRKRSVNANIKYTDGLKARHASLSISRIFNTSSYTPMRRFIGNHIVISAIEQESNSNSWQANLFVSRGIGFLNSKINILASYIYSNASMQQNGTMTDYSHQMLNIGGRLDFSLCKKVQLQYGITFNQNRIKIPSTDYSQATDGWREDLTVIIPANPFSIYIHGEYYRNEITNKKYKDFFLTDIKIGYKSKSIDVTLSLNNLLNYDRYSYVVTNDLMSSTYTNIIRGREALVSLYYKL